jgi:hypothetical protein
MNYWCWIEWTRMLVESASHFAADLKSHQLPINALPPPPPPLAVGVISYFITPKSGLLRNRFWIAASLKCHSDSLSTLARELNTNPSQAGRLIWSRARLHNSFALTLASSIQRLTPSLPRVLPCRRVRRCRPSPTSRPNPAPPQLPLSHRMALSSMESGNPDLSSCASVKRRRPVADPAPDELAALSHLLVGAPQPPRARVCSVCKNDYSIEVTLWF